MDKQKQIEEMAKEKCKHFDEEVCSKLNCKKDCKYYGKSNCYRCIHKDICQLRTFSYCEEKVKEKGCDYYQQEIPENAVVLTMEEFDEDYVTKEDRDYWKHKVEIYKEHLKKARKETAEKFAERAKEEAFVVFMGEPIIRASKIDEIAKEFTEGKV